MPLILLYHILDKYYLLFYHHNKDKKDWSDSILRLIIPPVTVTSPPEIVSFNHWIIKWFPFSYFLLFLFLLSRQWMMAARLMMVRRKRAPPMAAPMRERKMCVWVWWSVVAGRVTVMMLGWISLELKVTRGIYHSGKLIRCVKQLITITSFLSCSPSPEPSNVTADKSLLPSTAAQ